MYEYIEGKVIELKPTYVVLENYKIGYFIKISLSTYKQIVNKQICKLYLHQILKEDTNDFFGFFEFNERLMFRHLISVSGIGGNTARLILSSFSANELQKAIYNENADLIMTVKGIGKKTAQRAILDLKDKIEEPEIKDSGLSLVDEELKNEAASALLTLGFNKMKIERALKKILLKNNKLSVEDLIKKALQKL